MTDLSATLASGGTVLAWDEKQWTTATVWYVGRGFELPDDDGGFARYSAIRAAWQRYMGVRVP